MNRLQEHNQWIQSLAQRSSDLDRRLKEAGRTDVVEAQAAARKGLVAINFFASKLAQLTTRHAPEENRYCSYFVVTNPGEGEIRYTCISLYQETGNTHMIGLWVLKGEDLAMTGEYSTTYPGGLSEKLLGRWAGISLDKPQGLYLCNSSVEGASYVDGLYQKWVNGALPES